MLLALQKLDGRPRGGRKLEERVRERRELDAGQVMERIGGSAKILEGASDRRQGDDQRKRALAIRTLGQEGGRFVRRYRHRSPADSVVHSLPHFAQEGLLVGVD